MDDFGARAFSSTDSLLTWTIAGKGGYKLAMYTLFVIDMVDRRFCCTVFGITVVSIVSPTVEDARFVGGK